MIASLVFILGVVFGSFFNVVIYRVPLEKSIAKGRSMCPSCGHVLTSVELIPVVSIIINAAFSAAKRDAGTTTDK